ncbi:signal peptidase I [Cellulomonas sp. NPDC089187]|uniref:signal peptidase I n=1 Tax=Cellulomonas sp. NPDC089187 TaxID=3154970 RepID=UPI003415CA52
MSTLATTGHAPGPSADRRAPAPPRHRTPPPPPVRRIVSAALWTVVILFGLAYATSVAVPLWFTLNDQRLMIVTSGSMSGSAEGAFDAGDAVVLKQISDPSELRVGQVASFWPVGSDQLVTHRIVALRSLPVMQQDTDTGRMVPTLDPATGEPITRPYIFTKGDANASPDPDATPLSQVRGIVLDVHPRWGWVLDWAGSPRGRLILLGPPLLALATLEGLALLRERRTRPTNRREVAEDALLLG